MKNEGLTEIFPMAELSVMGFLELLPHLPRLWRRLKDAVKAVVSPHAIILVNMRHDGALP